METIARKNFFQILFVEHRYYGDSNPEGEDPEFKFLTVEQALEDFIQVVQKINVHDLPVIAFGGSYGGMLSAWIRLKYPHVIRGAVAGSAPVTYSRKYKNFDCDDYLKIVSETFGSCKNQIKYGFSSISDFSVEKVTETFNFCDTVNDDFTAELVDAFVGIAMANYPVENSFLIPGLPKWPAKFLCKEINSVNPGAGVKVVEKVVQMIFNGTGTATNCLPYNGIFSVIKNRPNSIRTLTKLSDKNKKPSKSLTDPINFSMDAWEYQTCTQLPMPVCHSELDIFPNSPNPTPESEQKYCSEKFGSNIDVNWLKNEMGFFEDGRQFSNIIFTNGKFDPWRAGAVPKSAKNKDNDVILIDIEDGAHHSELFAPGEDDPESIVHARNMIEEYVLKWALSSIEKMKIHKSMKNI